MPTLLVWNGYKFFFYANDHSPKHVHIVKGENFAKIELETLLVVESYFKTSELKKILSVVAEHREEFVRRWNACHQR